MRINFPSRTDLDDRYYINFQVGSLADKYYFILPRIREAGAKGNGTTSDENIMQLIKVTEKAGRKIDLNPMCIISVEADDQGGCIILTAVGIHSVAHSLDEIRERFNQAMHVELA